MELSIPHGAWPILLTPFLDNGEVDLAALDGLLDFYLKMKIPGLLALGQASEVLTLDNDERFKIAGRVAERYQGKLPVATVGNYGDTLDEQAASLRNLASLGIDIPVVAISLLPSSLELDKQLLILADNVDSPLGIYELPEPEHRLLTAIQVGHIAQSGRFVFMKDTCRQLEPFTAKVAAARNTVLKIFQANLKILPPSLDAGSHGFCGWMPIVAPELASQVCDLINEPLLLRQKAFEKLFSLQTFMVEQGFPASAKYILRKRGVKIGTTCRVKNPHHFTSKNMAALDAFLERQDWFAPI